MISSLKCLAKAEHCEAMARSSASVIGRRIWLVLAGLWRSLGDQASRFEEPPTDPEVTDPPEDRSLTAVSQVQSGRDLAPADCPVCQPPEGRR